MHALPLLPLFSSILFFSGKHCREDPCCKHISIILIQINTIINFLTFKIFWISSESSSTHSFFDLIFSSLNDVKRLSVFLDFSLLKLTWSSVFFFYIVLRHWPSWRSILFSVFEGEILLSTTCYNTRPIPFNR